MSNSRSDRYARQIQFSPIGEQGHARLAAARVAVLGCGALGTVAAEILARAGVAQLILIDRDVVEWTNLQRQSLYVESDAAQGRSKAAAACEHLSRINRSVDLQPIVADVSAGNVKSVLGQPDLVIDAADNFALRFLLNDWSLATQTPWVHGGCVGATGQVRLFSGNGAPCFRCIVPQPPPAASVDTCDTAGVVGSATHVIASLQATEAIKWLTGNHAQVRQTLLSVDLWNNRIREIEIPAELSSSCTACGRGELEFLSGPRGMIAETAAVLCGRDAVQISPPAVDHPTASESSSHSSTIDLSTIADRWSGLGRVQATAFFVRLFPDDTHTLTLFRDGRVVVTGTTDISAARALCDRFVGS